MQRNNDSLDRSRPAEDLIRALCKLRPDEVAQVAGRVAELIKHPAPEVRAEALSALFVTGRSHHHRSEALRALSRDADEAVRAKAAYAIAATSGEQTLSEDLHLLVRALRNDNEASDVRRAAYEALLLMFQRSEFPDPLEDFDPTGDVDWSWIEELEAYYG